MPEASDAQAILRENLKDAGCDQETICRCEVLARGEKKAELMRALSLHRRALLDAVHENQRRIDCLDYLIYQIEKQGKKTS
ncbi:MAG: hypothetical protein K2M42_03040 [Oscillospiraceae bacterium]|nr:hypothetical protein [Oscillospiraceae bacterium]